MVSGMAWATDLLTIGDSSTASTVSSCCWNTSLYLCEMAIVRWWWWWWWWWHMKLLFYSPSIHPYIHTYIHRPIYVHTYLPTSIKTYIHTYIHTYLCSSLAALPYKAANNEAAETLEQNHSPAHKFCTYVHTYIHRGIRWSCTHRKKGWMDGRNVVYMYDDDDYLEDFTSSIHGSRDWL